MNLSELISNNLNVYIKKGIYETKPIFLRSNQTITFEDGVIIKPILSDDYDLIKTRVAGINMMWYPAIINIIDCSNVKIYGKATIDGMGEYFWNKYWGEDLVSGMRASYDKIGLRWACDYDCMRLRSVLVQNSYNVEIHDIDLYRSGFWNLHILYSHDVLVHNVSIRTIDKESPSTDGIDIDSSYNVLVDGCFIDCFDDSICIKSGRDYDGLLTNIACHDVEIKNCTINKGFGITIGSEISGGAYNINIHDIKYNNTDCGFRIKSSTSRKGYIKNISIANFELLNVKYVFNIMTSWNPLYNKIEIKDGIEMKEEWKNILHEVDESIPNTIIDGIYVSNIKSRISDDYKGISRLFNIVGFDDMPIKNMSIKKLDSISKEYGIIKNAEVNIIDSNIRYDVVLDEDNNEFDNR